MVPVVAICPRIPADSAARRSPTPSLSPASRTVPTPVARIRGQRLRALARSFSGDRARYCRRTSKSTGVPSRNKWAWASMSIGNTVISGRMASGSVWPARNKLAGGEASSIPTYRIFTASYTRCAGEIKWFEFPSNNPPTRTQTGASCDAVSSFEGSKFSEKLSKVRLSATGLLRECSGLVNGRDP